MHDFSISRAIAQRIIKEAKERNASRVIEIELEIGELTFLSSDQLTFWLKELFRKTIAQDSRILVKKIAPHFKCGHCHYQGGLTTEENPFYHYVLPHFFCPRCGSNGIEIDRGRECSISKIRVEK